MPSTHLGILNADPAESTVTRIMIEAGIGQYDLGSGWLPRQRCPRSLLDAHDQNASNDALCPIHGLHPDALPRPIDQSKLQSTAGHVNECLKLVNG